MYWPIIVTHTLVPIPGISKYINTDLNVDVADRDYLIILRIVTKWLNHKYCVVLNVPEPPAGVEYSYSLDSYYTKSLIRIAEMEYVIDRALSKYAVNIPMSGHGRRMKCDMFIANDTLCVIIRSCNKNN